MKYIAVMIILTLAFACASCVPCACTLRDCADNIHVLIYADGLELTSESDIEIAWQIPGREGMVEGFAPLGSETIIGTIFSGFPYEDMADADDDSNPYIDDEYEEITIELYIDGQAMGLENSYPIVWKSEVCNECSGGPNCKDDMYLQGTVTIE
jgi:hypothetical protein